MFPEESDKIKRYVGGLPDMIHGSVVASKPKTMQEAIEIATELMDKKIHTFVERQTENKRKQVITQNNQTTQNRGRNGRALPRQDLVRRRHTGDLNPYALNTTITMMVHVLPNAISATELAICLVTVGVPPMPTLLTTKGALAGQKPTCYECGAQGHFKRDCPKLKTTTAVTKLEMAMLQQKYMRFRTVM
ncbi:reverse transcriptase domain-containing protein [Tanacetum coccineum]